MVRRVVCVYFASLLFWGAFAFLLAHEISGGAPVGPLFLSAFAAGGAAVTVLFWAVLVERFLIPVWQGMQDAERKYRLRRRLCLTCGYDLRASGDCCPECGTPRPGVRPAPQPTDSTSTSDNPRIVN
jgi:hypothetical protein